MDRVGLESWAGSSSLSGSSPLALLPLAVSSGGRAARWSFSAGRPGSGASVLSRSCSLGRFGLGVFGDRVFIMLGLVAWLPHYCPRT